MRFVVAARSFISDIISYAMPPSDKRQTRDMRYLRCVVLVRVISCAALGEQAWAERRGDMFTMVLRFRGGARALCASASSLCEPPQPTRVCSPLTPTGINILTTTGRTTTAVARP